MKSAVVGGRDPLVIGDEFAAYFCGYFGVHHCDGAYDQRQCVQRYAARYSLCVDAYEENIARHYFDCKSGETRALQFCRGELQDCYAACP